MVNPRHARGGGHPVLPPSCAMHRQTLMSPWPSRQGAGPATPQRMGGRRESRVRCAGVAPLPPPLTIAGDPGHLTGTGPVPWLLAEVKCIRKPWMPAFAGMTINEP